MWVCVRLRSWDCLSSEVHEPLCSWVIGTFWSTWVHEPPEFMPHWSWILGIVLILVFMILCAHEPLGIQCSSFFISLLACPRICCSSPSFLWKSAGSTSTRRVFCFSWHSLYRPFAVSAPLVFLVFSPLSLRLSFLVSLPLDPVIPWTFNVHTLVILHMQHAFHLPMQK